MITARRRLTPASAVVLLLAASICWIGSLAPAAAAACPITLAPTVDELTLTPGTPADAEVLVTNGGTQPATVTGVTTQSPVGVSVGGARGVVRGTVIAVGSTVSLGFDVTAGSGFAGGELGVVVSTSTCGTVVLAGTSVTVGVTAAVQPPTLTVSLPESLQDGDRRPMSVSVSNQKGPDLTDVTLDVVADEDLTVTTGLPVRIGDLAAGTTRVIDLEVHVDDRVHTGTHTLRAVVAARPSLTPDGPAVSAEATATTEVTVFGDDVLGAFGLSTLFVVPGVIGIVAYNFLARLVYPRRRTVDDLPDFKDAGALVRVLPASIGAYVVLWLVFGLDLRYETGTWPEVWLLVIGAGTGFVAWGLLALIYRFRTDLRTFRVSDTAYRVLRRMARRHDPLTQPQFTDGSVKYVVLNPTEGDLTTVFPVVTYGFPTNDLTVRYRIAALEKGPPAAFLTALCDAARPAGRLDRLRGRLGQTPGTATVELAWREGAPKTLKEPPGGTTLTRMIELREYDVATPAPVGGSGSPGGGGGK